jgi:hypothetical protein
MAVSRRTFILAGGGLALVAGAGLWRVMRTPETAARPWEALAVPEPDVRLDAFRHAILAPNPHNRQPWLIRLDGADGATIYCDLDRRLPMTDPYDRQITIGFGCFLELAQIAAAQRGIRLEISRFPEGEPQPRLDRRPIARVRFVAASAVERDPLFAAILERRSTKDAFEPRVPDAAQLQPLNVSTAIAPGAAWQIIATEADPVRVAAIRALVLEAVAIEMRTRRTHLESVALVRIGADEVDRYPDGIDLSGPGIEAMAAAGLISRAALADPASPAFRQGETMMVETYGAAPAFVIVSTSHNDRWSQLEAGRLYVRANLQATGAGLAMHPMSQALQEYPEMANVYGRMQALARPSFAPGHIGGEPIAGQVQMLARIGFAPKASPSPRWPLEAKLV